MISGAAGYITSLFLWNQILNRPTKSNNLLVILLAACMILAGAFIGLQAFSPSVGLSSLLPTWLRMDSSEQGTTYLGGETSAAQSVLGAQMEGNDQQNDGPSLREPIVIVDSDVVAQQLDPDTSAKDPDPSITSTALAATATLTATAMPEATETPTATATPTVAAPLALSIAGPFPAHLKNAIAQQVTIQSVGADSQVDLTVNFDKQGSAITYQQLYVAATRFDRIDLDLSWQELEVLWRSAEGDAAATGFEEIAVPAEMKAGLEKLLGPAGTAVRELASDSELAAVDVAWNEPTTLLLLPFEELVPRLAVFALDGQKPIENANRFDAGSYPLVLPLYLHNQAEDTARANKLDEIIAQLPTTNRDPSRLTVLAMTGVTAMVRYTAKQMDELGNAWPAEVVGAELAAADITHISNEVPFVADCETDIRPDNLNFCSKHEYFETLEACGVDIIGLTGNHQNDYGRAAALDSLEFYQNAGVPVYGGGVNKEAAFAPLYYEHNGNRLAFLGANSYGPEFAWATDNEPGSAEFDLNIMSATIRSIHSRDLADVVLTELQYQERYDVSPLLEQRVDFNALIHAGADIVTGVQSHVPQSMEFTDGRLILFGLGNLFFDQMTRQDTREGMFVKHTIYDGRHISTQIFTTLIYDAGQPRWTTSEEREALLTRVFDVSYWE